MKKGIKALVALAVIVSVSGCSEEKSKLDQILENGKIIVATSPDYVPMEFLDSDGNVVGSDISLAQHIADELGVELEIMSVDFSTTMISVDLGNADIAISGFGWTEEREDNFELSIGYNKDEESSCQGLIVPADQVNEYETLEDFSGLVIGAQANSLQLGYAQDQIPDATVEIFTDIGLGITELQVGKYDAVSLSCDLAKGYENAGLGLAKSPVEFVIDYDDNTAGNVIAVKKGETELVEAINEILIEVNEQGLYTVWDAEAEELAKSMGIDLGE